MMSFCHKRHLALVSLLLVASFGAAAAGAEDSATRPKTSKRVDFGREVYPLLQRACFECHGAEQQEGDLRLDRRADLLQSGTVTPGAPDSSELLRRITLPRADAEIMPAIGEPLTQREIALLRRWIAQGAVWPEEFSGTRHWAYVPPQRPAVPDVARADWASSELDLFVLKQLEQEGLSPSPRARPEVLVRRLYLDLIGLPPTPAEVNAFLEDPSDAGIARLVDDLLARPQFGERWARPWLDLARYADSHGFQRDNLRDIWPYRDWVIRALNADMPFDQFTIEQIAGDLLPDATQSQRIATGFHRCTPTNVEAGSLPEETRIEQVLDRVNTTGAVWLGTTLECCQCHDHKYDPFTMEDYYGLLAFFNSTEREADRANPNSPSSIKFQGPSMPISNPTRDARRSALQTQLDTLKIRQTQRQDALRETLGDWAAAFREQLGNAPQTHPLDVTHFESQGSTDSYRKLDDGSILLVGGDPPAEDVYDVRARLPRGMPLSDVRAVRLDALTHDSLPGSGPGRGDAKKTNFVLNEFTFAVRNESGDLQPLPLSGARADFSQKKWNVAGAVDGDVKTGWAIAPQFGKPHWAIFQLPAPLQLDDESELAMRLVQRWGQARTIGRFRLSVITGDVMAETIPAEVVAGVMAEPDTWSNAIRKSLLEYRTERDDTSRQLAREIQSLQKQIAEVEPDTTLVMIELDEPRETHVFQRGDYRNPGEPVEPGVPEVLHPLPDGPANRLTLARWLVDPANPLVARVTVNRWWAELFGRGLVATVEDFGIKGDPPTHPELLDWLAVEFMENGWSRKRLLKTIVLSATYQQSSVVTTQLQAVDDLNLWLARGPRFRMDAETIRDNALAIAGLLNLKQFGPPIRPYQPDGIWVKVGGTAYDYVVSPGAEQYRRGIYVVLKRGAPYPSFINFDASARLACTVKRSRTNTPLQALTLLNDPVYVEAAQALARRVLTECPERSLEDQLDYAFRLCTARHPTDRERGILSQLYAEQLSAARENAAEATRLAPENASVAPVRFAAWYSVATTLLNMHETITKE